MCFLLWSLILAFSLGAGATFVFWFILARIAMGDVVIPGSRGNKETHDGGNGRI